MRIAHEAGLLATRKLALAARVARSRGRRRSPSPRSSLSLRLARARRARNASRRDGATGSRARLKNGFVRVRIPLSAPPAYSLGFYTDCNRFEMEAIMSVILEIRAAEGGDDAKLLVEEQLKIYARFGARRGL